MFKNAHTSYPAFLILWITLRQTHEFEVNLPNIDMKYIKHSCIPCDLVAFLFQHMKPQCLKMFFTRSFCSKHTLLYTKGQKYMHYLYGMITAESAMLLTVGQNTNRKQNDKKYQRGILSETLYLCFTTTRYKRGNSVHNNCVGPVSPANKS